MELIKDSQIFVSENLLIYINFSNGNFTHLKCVDVCDFKDGVLSFNCAAMGGGMHHIRESDGNTITNTVNAVKNAIEKLSKTVEKQQEVGDTDLQQLSEVMRDETSVLSN